MQLSCLPVIILYFYDRRYYREHPTGDYMDFPIIEQFIKYLQAGRADNLKEAINLFEEEQHRGRVE